VTLLLAAVKDKSKKRARDVNVFPPPPPPPSTITLDNYSTNTCSPQITLITNPITTTNTTIL
jgi:hypothetical protein